MIILKKEKAKTVLHYKHPWVFRNSIKEVSDDHGNGDIVKVSAEDGTPVGFGFYSPKSLITVRMIEFGSDRPGTNWINRKIEKALVLRKRLHINSNAFRLINSEGDFFPGIIVDIYNKTAVIKVQIRGTERLIDRVSSALMEYLSVEKVYLKRDERAARIENLKMPGGYIVGTGSGTEQIMENGLLFSVDFARGQKTGFYLDQRDNRFLTKKIAEDMKVLNLFSYTGGFALYASAGGGSHVCSVESSLSAVKISMENEELNREKLRGKLEWQQGDAVEFLQDCQTFDIIILDPPPFARKRQEVPGALRAYSRLNKFALSKLEKHSFLLTFSCSGGITRQMFKDMLLKGALEVKRNIKVVSELHAAADHPYTVFHPEGEYLKGLLVYAE